MENICIDYEVNPRTMALLPAAHIDYETIVIEQDCTLYVKQTPLQIIKGSCLEGGSTYEGRRKAVTHLTGSTQKVPIPINPQNNIYAFPTHSPSTFECSWIFYNHIKFLKPVENSQSVITFKNEQQLPMNESHYILQKQVQRSAVCILLFSPKSHEVIPFYKI